MNNKLALLLKQDAEEEGLKVSSLVSSIVSKHLKQKHPDWDMPRRRGEVVTEGNAAKILNGAALDRLIAYKAEEKN